MTSIKNRLWSFSFYFPIFLFVLSRKLLELWVIPKSLEKIIRLFLELIRDEPDERRADDPFSRSC